jgi:dipeptidyl aminopeptidase/acylaminoacyl peptidase
VDTADKPAPKKSALLFQIVGSFLLACAGFSLWHYYSAPRYDREPDDPGYRQILSNFLAAQPIAVSVSPDGKYLLTKMEQNGGFKVSVLDRESKREVASSLSKCTQRALTWRPDSRAIAFQEISGLERPLYLLDVPTSKKMKVNAPVSHTALPPLRWDHAGKSLAYFDGDWQTGRLLVINPSGDDPPIVIQESLSGTCDFIWSPDGQSIAVASASDHGAITVTSLRDLAHIKLQVTNGEVRQLAWSPDGKSILAVARGDEDEFFKLFEVEIHRRTSSIKAQADGDISLPVWTPDGRSFIYHVCSNGIIRAFLEHSGSTYVQQIGPTNGVLRSTYVEPDGKAAYAHFSGLSVPPVVGKISLENGDWTVLYACPKSESCRCPDPEFLRIKSDDGAEVPAYHWPAAGQNGIEAAALIVVHGGSDTQTYPTWEAYIRPITELGCNVIAVNHRGSSGYGRRYEKMQGDPVADVNATRSYAANVLKVRPNRIFLTGISVGSRLIAAASGNGDEIGGLILVSWVGAGSYSGQRFAKPFPVLEFHGQLDLVMSPDQARDSIMRFFAGDGQTHFSIQFHTFRDEGHFFYDATSLAAVYWTLSKLVQPEESKR